MRQVLVGMITLIISIGSCMLLWTGILSVAIRPGNVNHSNGFTIQRDIYLDTQYGKMTPVMIESDTAITYTITIRK